ncbi:MAG: hypothetical protein H0V96_10900 [Acidimicrobiia bacterium]|nr:hypothetical protein [Acidimicrobiia bacterium]
MGDPVTLGMVAATARRVAEAMELDASRQAAWEEMATRLLSTADSVDGLDPAEALLDLRSALVMSRSVWSALDPALAADAARVLAGAKRLAIEL